MQEVNCNKTKVRRAIRKANVYKGYITLSAIMDQVPDSLADRLNSNDLATVIEAVQRAYHKGKRSTGAELCDEEFVWVDCLGMGFFLDQLRWLAKRIAVWEENEVKKNE